MAEVHGIAGEWARVRGTVASLMPLFISIGCLGFSFALFCFVSLAYGGAALVASLMAVAYFLRRGERRMESYFKGARGEEYVSGILKGLPDSYHIFNDFAAGRARVDHVVVGPSGVFSIETKCWSSRVTIEDGTVLAGGVLPSKNPLAQTLREAHSVKVALKKAGWEGAVTPILAFASNTFEAAIAECRGVVILNANHLVKSFDNQRVLIPPAELERLVRLMESNS